MAAWRLNRSYPENTGNIIGVGATRTAIGMGFGFVMASLVLTLVSVGGVSGLVIGYLSFIPIRLLEWWLLIPIFYDRQGRQRPKDWRCAGLGTVWSFVLDAPAILGLVATGGLWIC